jgi:hypothetical protein
VTSDAASVVCQLDSDGNKLNHAISECRFATYFLKKNWTQAVFVVIYAAAWER